MECTLPPRTTCRVCGSAELTELFSLGDQFVSDFVTAENIRSGPRVPITLDLCRSCTLVQQRYTAPSDFMFSRHYWYVSGTTATMRKALAEVVDAAMSKVQLRPGDVVADLGSNDGTLLRCYPKELGLVTVGVEPATNLAAEGSKGVDVFVNDFWSFDAVTHRINGEKAKIVTCIGMFYDLENPSEFVADIAKVLHPDGVLVAQLMCLKQTVEKADVGNLTHEHLLFFSLQSLSVLFGNNGLEIFAIEENNVNGGSYRLFVRHKGGRKGSGLEWERTRRDERNRVSAAFDRESAMGLYSPATYAALYARMCANRDRCVAFVRERVAAGESVWIYGSSTKGNVLAQFYGLDSTLIAGAADKSTEKHGRFMVGTGIPIVSEEVARAAADWFLVMPWAFRSEFVERERPWLAGRGRGLLFPLPTFEVAR